jgi:enterochelin esterase-like enzyme
MVEVRAVQGALWSHMEDPFGRDIPAWRSRDPAWRLRLLLSHDPSLVPALFIDVGRDDGLADENRAFNAELTALDVPHTYAEWPGKHDWAYWRAHVGESLTWIDRHIAP